MDAKAFALIRHDLAVAFPKGGYTVEWRPGEPIKLIWDSDVLENTRRTGEAILRVYNVPFESSVQQRHPLGSH